MKTMSETIKENWSPFGNDEIKPHIMQANAGKGRSLIAAQKKESTRKNGGLYVNVENKGNGMLPYEYELGRRYQANVQGPLPREIRKKKVTLSTQLSDGRTPINKQSKHSMISSNGYALRHDYLMTISQSLLDATGVKLNLPQLLTFLGETNTDQFVVVSHQDEEFIDMLMDKLSEYLIDTPWPRYSEQLGEDFPEPISKLSDLLVKREFAKRLNNAALTKNFKVVW